MSNITLPAGMNPSEDRAIEYKPSWRERVGYWFTKRFEHKMEEEKVQNKVGEQPVMFNYRLYMNFWTRLGFLFHGRVQVRYVLDCLVDRNDYMVMVKRIDTQTCIGPPVFLDSPHERQNHKEWKKYERQKRKEDLRRQRKLSLVGKPV